jgi:hypothetical protein
MQIKNTYKKRMLIKDKQKERKRTNTSGPNQLGLHVWPILKRSHRCA